MDCLFLLRKATQLMTFWFGWLIFGGVVIWTVPPVLWFVWRRLRAVATDSLPDLPSVSIIVPACNEADAIEQCLKSLLNLDYPQLEIIAINDRSTDSTGEIMERVAVADERCRIIHVTELPAGWLGKNHAMHMAAQQASGKLLLFTDGDIIHEAAALRSAVCYLNARRLQHLCLLPRMLPGGYFENCVVAFFGFAFAIGQQVHLTGTRWPFAYAGVGAFNLIDAKFYHSFGGHQRLAMDVIDDAKLGKLVKQHGGRQDFLGAPDLLSIRWYNSLWGVILGLEKNGFAALGYSIRALAVTTVLFLTTMVWPYVAVVVYPWAQSSGFAATIIVWHLMYTIVALSFGGSILLAPMFPVASWLMSFAFWRSSWVTLRQGGVRWRNSFYSLQELKDGLYR